MNILKAAIILLIAVTASIFVIKPQMHKPLRAENADFKLTIISETPKPAQNTLTKHAKTVKKEAEKTETVIIPQKPTVSKNIQPAPATQKQDVKKEITRPKNTHTNTVQKQEVPILEKLSLIHI